MRTFHIGGAASRATAQDNIQVMNDGTVRLHNLKTLRTLTVTWWRYPLRRTCLSGYRGRERERYKLPYGAVIKVGHDHSWRR